MIHGVGLILIGSLSFVLVLGYANVILKRRRQLLYTTASLQFAALYLVSSLSLVALLAGQQLATFGFGTMLLVACLILSYCRFGMLQTGYMLGLDHCALFGIPANAQIELCPTVSGQVVKVTEICFQQLCALLVLSGMIVLGVGLVAMTVMFTLLVFIVHVPSFWLFGRLFGGFFVWSSTSLAMVYPSLLMYTASGFIYMLIVHVGVYVLWYSYLIQRYAQTIKKAPG